MDSQWEGLPGGDANVPPALRHPQGLGGCLCLLQVERGKCQEGGGNW